MKKEYLQPQTEVITITAQHMLAFSGEVFEDNTIIVPTPDDEEGTNLIRMLESEDDSFSI